MPVMSPLQAAICRSAPWRLVARRLVLPWALQGILPTGRVLEIGAGSGEFGASQLTPSVRAVAEMGTAFLSGKVPKRWSAKWTVTPNQ
jgi:hypothetical protein